MVRVEDIDLRGDTVGEREGVVLVEGEGQGVGVPVVLPLPEARVEREGGREGVFAELLVPPGGPSLLLGVLLTLPVALEGVGERVERGGDALLPPPPPPPLVIEMEEVGEREGVVEAEVVGEVEKDKEGEEEWVVKGLPLALLQPLSLSETDWVKEGEVLPPVEGE